MKKKPTKRRFGNVREFEPPKEIEPDSFGRKNIVIPGDPMPAFSHDSVKVTTSSNLSDEFKGENVLKDDDSEWASNGDHKDAWIKLSFPKQLIKSISFADRKSPDASMVMGLLRLDDGDKTMRQEYIELDGAGGAGGCVLNSNIPIYCSSMTIQATGGSWGKNIGLRYFNFNK